MSNPSPTKSLRDALRFARQIDFTTNLSVAECGERLLLLSEVGRLQYPNQVVKLQPESPDQARFELLGKGYGVRIKSVYNTIEIVGRLARDDASGGTRVTADTQIGSAVPLIAFCFVVVTITSFADLLGSHTDLWFGGLLTAAFFAGSLYYTVGIGLQYRRLRALLNETLDAAS